MLHRMFFLPDKSDSRSILIFDFARCFNSAAASTRPASDVASGVVSPSVPPTRISVLATPLSNTHYQCVSRLVMMTQIQVCHHQTLVTTTMCL
jgi:hypothetical protein